MPFHVAMGVPDEDCPVAPAKKRPRLSLKTSKQKPEKLPKTAEEGAVKSPTVTDLSVKEEKSGGEDKLVEQKTSVESLASSDRDSRVPAVASLENFGNTCFMNSILQVLRYTPGFLENVAQLFQDITASEKIKRKNRTEETQEESTCFEEENCKKCWKVVRNVYRVYRDLSLLEDKYEEVASDDVMSMAVKPSKILNSVRELNPMFEGNLQHDAQEFLRCLLCYLQDAAKEVQKFYSQLPPRLSPRAVVLNPIMQRFLKAAQKAGNTPSKDNSKSNDIIAVVSGTNTRNTDTEMSSETVKVNLFPKASDVNIEEKSEAAKSPSKIQVAPNLGDTASVVDKKTSKEIQSSAIPKGDADDNSDIEMETSTAKSSVSVGADPFVNRPPSGSRRVARRGGRFRPFRKNSSSRSEHYEEMKLSVKPSRSGSKKSKKSPSPVDKLQPSISDMFVTKTYSSKKRLGMSGAILRKTPEELFDEVKASISGSKTATNTSGPKKAQSMPALNDTSNSLEMQPVVSLTDLHRKAVPEIKSTIPIHSDLENKQNDVNINANENSENSPSKNADVKSDTNLDEKMNNKATVEINENSKSDNSKSFQDIFAQFLYEPPIFDSDTDSVDLLTDSDNEDIVAQKKLAKHLHESPRRSPRKQLEMYQMSPRRSQSLNIKSETQENSSPRKALSFDCKNKLNLNKLKTMSIADECVTVTEDKLIKFEDRSSKMEEKIKNTVKQEECPENIHQKLNRFVMNNDDLKDRNLFPVIQLEKCDHVFDGHSTSVNANYAAKCLTPMKNSPKESDPSDSRNYLKRRNLLEELDIDNIKDESDLKKAIEEMYNSPVKSRSKCDLIERLFQGSMILRTRCLQCESSRERREDFHDVSVPVRLEKSESDDEEDQESDSRCGLMKLIEASTEVEKLHEDNKYYCEGCKCYVEAERSMLYDVMPDILTLHLKRFSATTGKYSSITKINDEVEIPFTLPCLRYRCPKVCLRPDHRYSLYAVVTHSGVTLTAGHYLAYVRALPKSSVIEKMDTEMQTRLEVKEDAKSEMQTDTEKQSPQNTDSSDTKLPMTRKKMGITAKLPSRFDNTVTNTKVKTFKGMTKVKPIKQNLADCLIPSKRFSTEWFECDDETVRVFSEEDFKDLVDGRSGALLGTPYLLFYHKATMV